MTGQPASGHTPIWAIVLAAGSGERYGAPKQFAKVADHRLVDLAVEVVDAACQRVVLALPPGTAWDGRPVDHVVAGGHDRAGSVRAALDTIPDETGVVVVHQAANPLATANTIRDLLGAIEAGADAAVPGLRPADLVRYRNGDVVGAVVGRDELVLIQTPAAFRLEVLRAAHAAGGPAIEDTALVTAAGYDVRLLPGDPRNVHVATTADRDLVEALLRWRRR